MIFELNFDLISSQALASIRIQDDLNLISFRSQNLSGPCLDSRSSRSPEFLSQYGKLVINTSSSKRKMFLPRISYCSACVSNRNFYGSFIMQSLYIVYPSKASWKRLERRSNKNSLNFLAFVSSHSLTSTIERWSEILRYLERGEDTKKKRKK